MKGPKAQAEIEAAVNAEKILNCRLIHKKSLSLPGSNDPRALVVYEKTGDTPAKYPRKPGVPTKKPL